MYILMINNNIVIDSIESEKEAIEKAKELCKDGSKVQVLKLLGEVIFEPYFKKLGAKKVSSKKDNNDNSIEKTAKEIKEWAVVTPVAKTFAIPELKEIDANTSEIEDTSEQKLQDLEQRLQDVKHPFEIPLKELEPLETNEKEESVGIEKTFEVQEIGNIESEPVKEETSEKIFNNSLGFTMSEDNVKKQAQNLFKEALEQKDPLLALGNEIEKMCNWYKDDSLHEYKWFRDLCDEYQILATQKLGAISNLNVIETKEVKEVKEDSNDDIHLKNLQTLRELASNPNYMIDTIQRIAKSSKFEDLRNTKYKDEYELLLKSIFENNQVVEKDSLDLLQDDLETTLKQASKINEAKVYDVINNRKYTELKIKRKDKFMNLSDFYINEGVVSHLVKSLSTVKDPEKLLASYSDKTQQDERVKKAIEDRRSKEEELVNNSSKELTISEIVQEIDAADRKDYSSLSLKYSKKSLAHAEIKEALDRKELENKKVDFEQFKELIKDKSDDEVCKLANTSKYFWLKNDANFKKEYNELIQPKITNSLVTKLIKELPSIQMDKLTKFLERFPEEVQNDTRVKSALNDMKTCF